MTYKLQFHKLALKEYDKLAPTVLWLFIKGFGPELLRFKQSRLRIEWIDPD